MKTNFTRFVGKIKDLTARLIESHVVATVDEEGRLVSRSEFPVYLQRKDTYVMVVDEYQYIEVKQKKRGGIAIYREYGDVFYQMYKDGSYDYLGWVKITKSQFHGVYSDSVDANNLMVNRVLQAN